MLFRSFSDGVTSDAPSDEMTDVPDVTDAPVPESRKGGKEKEMKLLSP